MSDHMVSQQQPGPLDATLSGLLVRSGRRDTVAFAELYAALRADVQAQARRDAYNVNHVAAIVCGVFLEVWHLAAEHARDGRGVRKWIAGITQVRVDERNRHNGSGRRFLAEYDSHSERELSAVLSTNSTVFASTAGTWRRLITYSGDGNNSPTTSACGVENFTITNS